MHGVLGNKIRYRNTNEYLYKTLPLILHYSPGISDNTQLFTTCINTTVINITSIMASSFKYKL